ncbi:MAG: hypothetical protein ACTHKG_10785 [Nocardioides sp.]
MSPFSAPVLGGAALMSAPAWWHAVDGTVPAGEAVTRFLICVAICWVALEVLTTLVGPAPARAAEGGEESTAEPAETSLPV